LLPALQRLKSATPAGIAAMFLRGMLAQPVDRECLDRLRLARPKGLTERLYAALVRGALQAVDGKGGG